MEITHVLAGHCWRGDLHGESSEIKPVGKGTVLDQDNYPHFPSLNQSPSVALSEQLTGGKQSLGKEYLIMAMVIQVPKRPLIS